MYFFSNSAIKILAHECLQIIATTHLYLLSYFLQFKTNFLRISVSTKKLMWLFLQHIVFVQKLFLPLQCLLCFKLVSYGIFYVSNSSCLSHKMVLLYLKFVGSMLEYFKMFWNLVNLWLVFHNNIFLCIFVWE